MQGNDPATCMAKVPSSAVVAIAVVVVGAVAPTHFADTVALSSALPIAAVPLMLTVATGSAGAVPLTGPPEPTSVVPLPPPPHALSDNAAILETTTAINFMGYLLFICNKIYCSLLPEVIAPLKTCQRDMNKFCLIVVNTIQVLRLVI
jgi:hypothetical protein